MVSPSVVLTALKLSWELCSGVKKFLDSVKHSDDTLDTFKMKLNNARADLIGWCVVWGFCTRTTPPIRDPKFDEATLKEFWKSADGEEDQYVLITNKLVKIHEAVKDINDMLLRFQQDDEIKRPRKLQKKPPTSSSSHQETTATERKIASKITEIFGRRNSARLRGTEDSIDLALRESKLFEKLEELRNNIALVEDTSLRSFNSFRRAAPRDEFSHEDVQAAGGALQAMNKFLPCATKLHSFTDTNRIFSLRLRKPDGRGNGDWTEDSCDIDIDLTLHVHGQDASNLCEDLTITYNPDQDLENWSSPFPVDDPSVDEMRRMLLSHSLRKLFERAQLQARARDKVYWQYEQPRLILYLTNWFLLLLNSPWNDSLCPCSLRVYSPLVTPQWMDASNFVMFPVSDAACINSTLSSRFKVLQYGLSIAEILLQLPLRIKSNIATLPIESQATQGIAIQAQTATTESLHRSSTTQTTTSRRLDLPSRAVAAHRSIVQAPIQAASPDIDINSLEFESFSPTSRTWSSIRRKDIISQILYKPMAQAVSFCFENPDLLANGETVETGDVLKMIQKLLPPAVALFERFEAQRAEKLTEARWSQIWRSGEPKLSDECFDPGQKCRLPQSSRKAGKSRRLPHQSMGYVT
jgi:hypothetical protein